MKGLVNSAWTIIKLSDHFLCIGACVSQHKTALPCEDVFFMLLLITEALTR